MHKNLVLLTACAVGFCLLPAELLANPSTKDPDALLKIRPADKPIGDHLATDYAAIQARYTKAQTASDELWRKYEAKKLAIGDVRQIGPLYLMQAAVRRDADFLKLRGETCGYDLSLRLDVLDVRLRKLVGELLSVPGVNPANLRNQIQKSSADGQKRLPQIEALIKGNKIFPAEQELIEIHDDIMRNAVWFPGTDFTETLRPFATPLKEATQLRQAQVLEELQQITAQVPDFTQLRTELSQAATALGGSGQASWNGQAVSGPQLLLAWNEQWPKVQAAAQRSALADWTSEQIGGVGNAKYQARLEAQKQFAQALPAGLASIVQADAQRVRGPEAAALYQQYVAAIGALCAFGPRQELEAAFAPALSALAKQAGLEQEIAAYRAATEPVLAWKRFFARAQAKRLAGDAPRIHDWCANVLQSREQPEESLVKTMPPDIRTVRIASTPNRVLPGVLPEQKSLVVIGDVVPVGAAGGRGVSRYRDRVFATLAAPPEAAWQAACDQLAQSLLASEPHSPLTLDAATALAGARLAVFESAGGPVEMLTVEPLLTRFNTLSDQAGSLLARGPLPADEHDAGVYDPEPVLGLTVRCDVLQPVWLQHECFVLLP